MFEIIDDISEIKKIIRDRDEALYNLEQMERKFNEEEITRKLLPDIIGESMEMINVKNLAIKASRTNSTVLLLGESGTGKSLLAKAIHNNSKNKDKPFINIICGSIPEMLLESELFGYMEGAFTGAIKGGKAGLFELAHNGTLFLDEIGDMAINLQARLLRVIQEREIMRLGGSQNVGSTESMQSVKSAELFQGPVEEAMSRALTLACRLYGVDCYVELAFNPIDLRPASELEAHLAIRQNRALELLSYGRITDDECQALLSLGSLPAGAENLSGTKFLATKTPDSLPVAATNSRNRQISPEGPTSGGGSSNDPAP